MDIEQLAEALYEDLNGYISSVQHTNTNTLTIHFCCDNWRYDEQHNYSVYCEPHESYLRHFMICCYDVVEHDIHPTSSGELTFTDQHPLLWDYNAQKGGLYYSTAATASSYELLGRIWSVHQHLLGDWRPMSNYINTYKHQDEPIFGNDGNGLLANGPKPLLEAYQQALSCVLKTRFVPSVEMKGGVKALLFDSGFVICKRVELQEIFPDAETSADQENTSY
ncbi:hypothetical protein F6Q07_18785 [Pectobacterium parmentieri]|uniref:Uncharacterized protein n=1 Tax=Pectobacterium parmentieri TaxID=1905730 RepID=A0A0H3HZV1_PECPM|nr:hypothetical protein [Pectobacterium parmentieri]ACX86786.1 conserved hypothetical protein [Pectobacterium parmentieri WPP163]AFI88979.1 Hypothetical protein W5S_0861 [Pectobacterium parmentieri]AOR60018.1 hypothetical protein A8F97_14090 [Pectobacterium parmentieri]AYH00281.1 hypothetical protein C5E26_04585 [Pectobacterium parmentieri]AYH09003.1 hypothetical protein C5E24_04425 [Pectobacterium parmentieri]